MRISHYCVWSLLSVLATHTVCAQVVDTMERVHPIDKVVVAGQSSPRKEVRSVGTPDRIDRQLIESHQGVSLLSLLSEQIPGFYATERGVMGYGVSTGAAGGISMRGIGGSPTTGVSVLLDGVPQYVGIMGHPIADALGTTLVERVEVTRGVSSLHHGSGAMGGVINIVTQSASASGLHLKAHTEGGSYNSLRSEGVGSFQKRGFQCLLAGSYRRSDGHRRNMDFQQQALYAKLKVDIGKIGFVQINAQGTRIVSSNPGTVASPLIDNDADVRRLNTSALLSYASATLSGQYLFFVNRGNHAIDEGYSPTSQPQDYLFHSNDYVLGGSGKQCWRYTEGGEVVCGVEWTRYGGRAYNRYRDSEAQVLLVDKTCHQAASYVEISQRLATRVMAHVGVRVATHSVIGTEWIPQGSIAYNAMENIVFRASVSKGFRFPTIREMYLSPKQNPELRPERVMSYELSVAGDVLNQRMAWSLCGFWIYGDNQISSLLQNGTERWMNTGKVNHQGVEATWRYRITKVWSARIAYSYLHMRYPVVAVPTHKCYSGIDFAKNRWSGFLSVNYVDGLYVTLTPIEKHRYMLWSARVAFQLAKWIRLSLRGENLLNSTYEINEGYPMPGTTLWGGIDIHL
jgi:iron complex outermembrane receptor protein